jgi:hypothetical protein
MLYDIIRHYVMIIHIIIHDMIIIIAMISWMIWLCSIW